MRTSGKNCKNVFLISTRCVFFFNKVFLISTRCVFGNSYVFFSDLTWFSEKKDDSLEKRVFLQTCVFQKQLCVFCHKLCFFQQNRVVLFQGNPVFSK